MHFYIIFLFLQEKGLKYTIFMISFIENALKFYYKYLIKTKLKNYGNVNKKWQQYM